MTATDSQAAVFKASHKMAEDATQVRGHDFNQSNDFNDLAKTFYSTGFQATKLGEAIEIVKEMIQWENDGKKCKIFLGYTSNMVSCGVREVIRFLCQHKMVSVLCTSAGGVEEDFIKCLAPTYILQNMSSDGVSLRQKGLNRISNLLVPNENYCKFEDWIFPILDQMLNEQNEQQVKWTPSRIINRLGKEINHPDSIYYWCYKNEITVYCPALTDGSLGDMIYFHSYKSPGLVVDLVDDIRGINSEAVFAECTGMIILGGGVMKHHICNANLMRNGANYAVYINTGHEFDGSDAGAPTDEAISWGKIRMDAKHVKVNADASLIFPILVQQTFAANYYASLENNK